MAESSNMSQFYIEYDENQFFELGVFSFKLYGIEWFNNIL